MNEPITRVFLVRHGESEANRDHLFNSAPPGVPLTNRGRSQARATGELLRRESVQRIYASPMLRTQQTAGIIGEAVGAEVRLDPAFLEVNVGEWDGMSYLNLMGDLWKAWEAGTLDTPFPGGESPRGVSERVLPALHALLEIHRGESFVIVTHALPVGVIVSHWLDEMRSFAIQRIKVASVTELEFTGPRGQVVSIGKTDHIPAEIRP